MSTASRFNTFLKNIKAKEEHHTDALTSVNAIARKLHGHYSNAQYTDDWRMIVGSYGKGTAISPPRDVDLLFFLPAHEHTRYTGYRHNGQSALLQEIKGLLLGRYPRTEIRGDGQVVVVEFSTRHRVEVLPGWRRQGGGMIVPNTHNGGSWQHVDHHAEIAHIAESDARTNGNTRSLIQMMKVWQDCCSVPIKSLVLELESVAFLQTWAYARESTVYYDWMVRDFFAELTKKANHSRLIPGTSEFKHYGDAWLSRATSAHARAVKACQLESENRHIEAALEWRKIFGEQYEF
ncbi:SMODS domain-containing nucleotidyltransferase [Streptomyces bambusae]|uniref:Nucleotidyltransferase n=1 Tax=Streptomyces bambusae TaxID=1550616 RepID=A0ABS6Z1K2_9ACTN|nr:nucleotidyltransferase [Streptomyces bambusae]MBW5481128.1 nucleotidyltransferase [Streptomyces bambusae]